jgi:hypothetical protein
MDDTGWRATGLLELWQIRDGLRDSAPVALPAGPAVSALFQRPVQGWCRWKGREPRDLEQRAGAELPTARFLTPPVGWEQPDPGHRGGPAPPPAGPAARRPVGGPRTQRVAYRLRPAPAGSASPVPGPRNRPKPPGERRRDGAEEPQGSPLGRAEPRSSDGRRDRPLPPGPGSTSSRCHDRDQSTGRGPASGASRGEGRSGGVEPRPWRQGDGGRVGAGPILPDAPDQGNARGRSRRSETARHTPPVCRYRWP